MTLLERLNEIETYFNYWVGNYQRKELTTNNVRITTESVAKACIIKVKGESLGNEIILGKHGVPSINRRTSIGDKLTFAELIQTLREIGQLPFDFKAIELQFELIRTATNKGSHSSSKSADLITLDDLEICNTSIKVLLKWFYKNVINQQIPQSILEGFDGKINLDLLDNPNEKYRDFEMACNFFDRRKFQYILVSPERISDTSYTVQAFAKLPWRLVLDFNPKSDEEEIGLLSNFIKAVGQGYKKVYSIRDKIEFDPLFPHYWFMVNGQGIVPTFSDYKQWKSKYKRFLSDTLFQSFIKGSRVKSRIVVLLNIDPFYAEDIIDEFNRLDEENLRFILCSETENYENLFAKTSNIQLVRISADDIANGFYNSVPYDDPSLLEQNYLIPNSKDDKRIYLRVTQDHYDYMASLGIEVVFKGIENTIASDDTNGFFKGSTISWRDLSEQKDITRNSYEMIQKRLAAKLKENKLEEIHLVHEAGAGGTTLARRIGYDFSINWPTVILRKYHHKKTIDGLRILYDQYTKGSLPLLIITESYEVKDTHLLYRDLSNAKKNAVILIVQRGSIPQATNKKFTLKAQLEGNEIHAFESNYVLLSPAHKEMVRSIPKDYKDNQNYITPVIYALTAFGKEYNGLENYVEKGIEGITLEQKKLAGFICLIYYYTQRSVPAEILSSLFGVTRNKCDFLEILGQGNPLLELLHQEADTDEYYNIWRPRYALVGEEAMKIILGGGAHSKRNWKNNLASWLLELIRYIRVNLEYLDSETIEIFNSLFIERSALDDGGQDKEFTKAINDLLEPNNGVAIFEALTEAYPNEAHFHGHFARYLYSSKVGIKNFNKAIGEAEKSLDIYPDNSSLIHTLGMCYREKAEHIINSYEQQGLEPEIAEEEVKALTELASDTFDDCIDVDPNNIYGYESQIRVILKTLDFGFRIHQASSKESFITDSKNSWYAEKLDKVSRLLEEALFVIEQAKKLENKERIEKSAGYVYDCEGLFFRTLGKHLTAKSKFESLIKNTPKGYEYMRPHYRRMFVMCLLASKTQGQRDLSQGWARVSDSELSQCVQYLDANIFEDPNNTQNIRLWLQAVRYTKTPPALINCIAKIGSWTQVSQQNSNSILEGFYYLYVLNSVLAISEGNTFDPTAIQTVKELQEKMKPFIKNEKFCYEWYGRGDGIKKMVNHKQLGEFSSDFFRKNNGILAEVTGRIKGIDSSQKGSIILDCGLEAFFVPHVAGFTERNKNDRIKCYIGFRYDQIQAWSVILNTVERDEVNRQDTVELNEYIEESSGEEIGVGESENLKKIVAVDRRELPKLSGPVVIGKIDLASVTRNPKNLETKSRQTPEFRKNYNGVIKRLSNGAGYIETEYLDKDIAFNSSHLRGCTFEQLAKEQAVVVILNFVKNKPKTDATNRNYIARSVSLA